MDKYKTHYENEKTRPVDSSIHRAHSYIPIGYLLYFFFLLKMVAAVRPAPAVSMSAIQRAELLL